MTSAWRSARVDPVVAAAAVQVVAATAPRPTTARGAWRSDKRWPPCPSVRLETHGVTPGGEAVLRDSVPPSSSGHAGDKAYDQRIVVGRLSAGAGPRVDRPARRSRAGRHPTDGGGRGPLGGCEAHASTPPGHPAVPP
jgi:hypothetical protein